MSDDDFFKKTGTEIGHVGVDKLVVGETYPIYGMITRIIKDSPGAVVVEINTNIFANLLLQDLTKIELIKERAFDPGIFMCQVVDLGEPIVVDCHTIIFGKKLGDIQ